ncbi:MAG: nicotinate phosphoribosyltransferase [Oscillospiraceae bacterium]|nr:nicotinate phosphoribosyltransferase [Oscillospiraceae bacterium]
MNRQLNNYNCKDALVTDFYEFTMSNGYFLNSPANKTAYFDLFFRRIPDNGGFAILAGLAQAIDWLKNIHFSTEDVEYLREQGVLDNAFLDYLKNFRFSCDVWAIPEGTPVFPGVPLITVRGPVVEAQFIETMLLLIINHQSLIATKANRMVRAAGNRRVIEFGTRRAHGADSAIYGARAAYIGGADATSCTAAGQLFGIPVAGTMAHSWVQLFDSEYDAFRAYAETYPGNCVLLADTYNTLQSGVPNAIRVFRDVLLPMGCRPKAIRIDSGDITYLANKARRLLDDGGFPDCQIIATNSLDEYIIRDMLLQGAKVDCFGVGERLITAASDPVFGGVYKLAAIEDESGNIIPKIKISENIAKLTTPCFKRPWRLYDRESGKALADVLLLHDEVINDDEEYEIFDPDHIWKRKKIRNFRAMPLQKQIFSKGRPIYTSPSVGKIRNHCIAETETLWDEVKRFENPHRYYVDLSQALWEQRAALLQ